MRKIFEEFRKKIEYETRYWDESVFKEKFDAKDIEVLENLYESLGKINMEYEPEEMEVLKNYKLPEIVIDFYKSIPLEYVPCVCGARFKTIEDFIEENTEYSPGALIVKFGYITIATTIGGNAVCLDLNDIENGEPSVIIFDHSIDCDREITIFNEEKRIFESEELSIESIRGAAVLINHTFTGFLQSLIDDEMEDVEDYLE